MAVSAYMYSNAPLSIVNKEIDWNTDAIKVALCTSAYTPDQNAHNYYDDITNELATAGGYTAGGAALGTPTQSTTLKVTTLNAADVAWTSATFTARYAIIYDSTPATAATKPLIGYVDFGADVSPVAGTLTITWNASGIFTLTDE